MFDTWGVGSADRNNGVLFLLAIDDQNYYCALGAGLEGSDLAAQLQTLLNDYAEPGFAAADYDASVTEFTNAVGRNLSAMYGLSGQTTDGAAAAGSVTSQPTSEKGEKKSNILTTILVIVFILIAVVTKIIRSIFRWVFSGFGLFSGGNRMGGSYMPYSGGNRRYGRHGGGMPPPPRGQQGVFGGGRSDRQPERRPRSSSFGGGRSGGSGAGRMGGGSSGFGGGGSRGGGAGRG